MAFVCQFQLYVIQFYLPAVKYTYHSSFIIMLRLLNQLLLLMIKLDLAVSYVYVYIFFGGDSEITTN